MTRIPDTLAHAHTEHTRTLICGVGDLISYQTRDWHRRQHRLRQRATVHLAMTSAPRVVDLTAPISASPVVKHVQQVRG